MTHRTSFTVVAVVMLMAAGGCGAANAPRANSGAPAPDPAAAPAPNAPQAGTASGAAAVGAASPGASAGDWDVSKLPDPCLTLNRAQVKAATGLSVTAGVPLDSWPPLCSFTLDGPGPEYLYVSSDPRTASREDFDRERSDSQATQAITGIGDQAYWLPEFTALHVYRGTTHLTIKFAGSAVPKDAQAKAIALAKVALR